MLLDGTVHVPLDQAGCREMAQRLRAMGVEAVAIVFLYAYAQCSPRAACCHRARRDTAGASVSLERCAAVFREYERAMATVLNAYVQPVVSRYISKLASGCARVGFGDRCSLWHRRVLWATERGTAGRTYGPLRAGGWRHWGQLCGAAGRLS